MVNTNCEYRVISILFVVIQTKRIQTIFCCTDMGYYAPDVGRFISEDPIRSGMNWYVAFNNNPLSYIDPLGLAAVAIRDFVDQSAGGKTDWNKRTSIATFTVDGKKLTTNASGSDNNGGFNIWNENGTMMADDSDLSTFFNIAGTVTIYSYFDPNNPDVSSEGDNFGGHAFISYKTLGGDTTFYGTWGWGDDGAGLYTNRQADIDLGTKDEYAPYVASNSKMITNKQKNRMYTYYIENPLLNDWSEGNNCSVWAANAFRVATGKNYLGVVYVTLTPKALKSRIENW